MNLCRLNLLLLRARSVHYNGYYTVIGIYITSDRINCNR